MSVLLRNKDLETILTFLGMKFIDYKGKRCSDGHKTARTFREVREFFGKDVMVSGQFVDDIRWWDFKKDWNDIMLLVREIREVADATPSLECENLFQHVKDSLAESDQELAYYRCMEFIDWYNENNPK